MNELLILQERELKIIVEQAQTVAVHVAARLGDRCSLANEEERVRFDAEVLKNTPSYQHGVSRAAYDSDNTIVSTMQPYRCRNP